MSKFTEKLKHIGKLFKGGAQEGGLPAHSSRDAELTLDKDVLDNLGIESELSVRIKAMQSLAPEVRCRKLQDHAVEVLWIKIEDLAQGTEDQARRETWMFLEAVICGQFDQIDIMRAKFFQLIKGISTNSVNDIDLIYRVKILNALTLEGKDIKHFEDEIGIFMQNLWPLILANPTPEILHTYLNIIINLLKFNAAYLDTGVVNSFIKAFTKICATRSQTEITLCLSCLDAIICYSNIPREGLFSFVCLLSKMVNLEVHCVEAWRISKNLMGTHFGHSALYSLCQILQSSEFKGDVALTRGAIFLIGMSLWGAHRVSSLEGYSAMTILPTFESALECKHQLVLYEIILQSERLVGKHYQRLRAPGCDSVVRLTQSVVRLIPEVVDVRMRPELITHINSLIDILERLSIRDRYLGSKHKLYDLIDACSNHRPEESVIGLMTYRINDIYTTKPGWIQVVWDLMEKYFIQESRPKIRSWGLQCLLQIYKSNRQIHEEEIFRKLILPTFTNFDKESELVVRLEGIKIMTAICIDCSSKKCIELLDIIEKIMLRPIELKNEAPKDANIKWADYHFEDIYQCTIGLIDIFCSRICQYPFSIPIRAYNILVKHLEVTYNNLDVFGHIGATRKSIFQLFMQLRANENFHLGVEKERGQPVHYSPYLICKTVLKESSNPSGNIGKNVSYLKLDKACLMVIKSLELERDYQVLSLVLDDVPLVLEHKAIFTLYGSDINKFIYPLIALTSPSANKDKEYPDMLFNLPEPSETGKKFSKGDFQNKVYPVLAAIAPYADYLEMSKTSALTQSKVPREIVKAIQNGLTHKECSRTCIVALTACSLEMKKTMHSMIGEVLLRLSKIALTKHVAAPMLEFLSTLIRVPEIFRSFIDDQYLTVFAIALRFTNPFKFDSYTVSLAHHVIIMWFLKCRLHFRAEKVSFIIKGLNSNIQNTLEEARRGSIATNKDTNKDTTKVRTKSGGAETLTRLRSNSFSENSPERAKMRHSTGVPTTNLQVPAPLQSLNPDQDKKDKMMAFHSELSETCVDILSTYAYANLSAKPKRIPTAEFLLKNGQSCSWIIGTKIVTITTSTCDQTSNRGSLCDRCYLVCSRQKPEETGGRHKSSEGIGITGGHGSTDLEDSSRRRHMSDAPIGSPNKQLPPLLTTTRRGSTEKIITNTNNSKKSSNEDLTNLESLLESQKDSDTIKKQLPDFCSCWCNGWAEVHVRRPSGDVSWMTRVQNSTLSSESHADFPLKDLTSLFHPDKEEPSLTSLESLTNKGNEENINNETYSIFTRNRSGSAGSDRTSSAPSSPMKEVRSPEFPSVTPEPESPRIKSPKVNPFSSPEGSVSSTKTEANKQSCDPIPEVDEEDRHLQRRTSLQQDSKQVNLLRKEMTPPASALATPPRSGSRTPQQPSSNSGRTKAAQQALQTGSYGSSGTGNALFRNRSHTVSGLSPARSNERGGANASSVSSSGSFSFKSNLSTSGLPTSDNHKLDRVTGISPQFVFLTLYHSNCFGSFPTSERPMLINTGNKSIEASMKILDNIYPHEAHKIGVLYVGPDQANNEQAILANPFGSLRYTDFLHGLGSLICLKDVDRKTTFLGGLDAEVDGDFAYMWEDDLMQVIFHVATLMPTDLSTDPKCNKKKRHIGNDFVAIVYNNAGGNQGYTFGTVKGQFIHACVVITPLDQGSNRVEIQCKPELNEPLEHIKDPRIVSDRNLAVLVRQVALHCNLAANMQRSGQASNWLERMKAIKRIREKVIKDLDGQDKALASGHVLSDFTAAVLR